MNIQEIFDLVVEHALKQKKQSYDNLLEMCKYRGPSGTKCFVGFLIPDELYFGEMEGKLISVVLEEFPKVAEYLLGNNINPELKKKKRCLLEDLQELHDNYMPNRWKDELEGLSVQYELKWKF